MIYLLVPAFNEEPNIPELQSSLTAAFRQHQVHYVFVDDASSDNTVAVVKELFKNEKLDVLTKSENAGPGHSFNLGMSWILDRANPEDFLITMEADNTSDPELIPVMITLLEHNFDLTLASVYAQSGGFSQTSLFRKLLSIIANMAFRGLFNVKVLTLSSFYRGYRVSKLNEVRRKYGNLIDEPGFICMLEILMKIIVLNGRIIEIPMVLDSNKRIGKSKMKVIKTSLNYMKFLFKAKRKIHVPVHPR